MSLLALVHMAPAAAAAGPALTVSGDATLAAPVMLWIIPGAAKDIDFRLTAPRADWGYFEYVGAHAAGFEATVPHSARIPLPGKVQNLSASGHSWTDGAAIVLLPLDATALPTVRFEASGLRLEMEPETCKADPLPYKTLTEPCHHVGGTGKVTADGSPSSIVVSGSFRLRMWGIEGEGKHRNGTWGYRDGPDGPLRGDVRVVDNHLDDVRVHDGEMTLALRTGAVGHLDVRNATVQVAGSATGTRGTAVWPGPVQAHVDFAQTPPVFSLQASPPAPAPPPLAAQAGEWDWVLPATAIGLVVALAMGAGLYFLLRPRNPVLRALHAGKPAQAARLAAMAGPAQSAEESAVRAVAYIQAGELALAEKQLVAYALPPADHLFVMATLRARQGRPDEARQLLRECLALDPAYANEVRFNADLSRLGDEGPPGGLPPREGYT